MTLTNSTKLASAEAQGDFAEAANAETVSEVPEALAFEGITPVVNGDWTYSATAEDLGTAGALDGEPGFIYSGPVGGAVRVKYSNLDLSAGVIIAPSATVGIASALYKNSELVDYCDEGFTVEMDAVTAETNLDTYVGGLQTGDVLRVAVLGDGDETDDIDVAVGGTFNIV